MNQCKNELIAIRIHNQFYVHLGKVQRIRCGISAEVIE